MASNRTDEDVMTRPVQASALRKGEYVMLKGKVCKIVEITTSKPGKHGHAKVCITGVNLATGRKVEDASPSTHKLSVPQVTRHELTVSNVGETHVSCLTDAGDLVSLPLGASADPAAAAAALEALADDQDLVAHVLYVMGEPVVKELKVKAIRK